MLRLLIIGLLAYFGYRTLRSWMSKADRGPDPVSSADANRLDDIMVKDPHCGVYFPKRDGIRETVGGQTHYFCSRKCRDAFFAARNDTH